MTAMFSVRRRTEEFAVALDGNADVTALHPELRELVGVATGLRQHAGSLPRPEFVASLRERLMVEADTVLTASNASLALPIRTRGRRERRMVAAAAAVVLVGGTAGMAAAAQEALPGEALYPVKRGIERAQAGLSATPAGKGRDLLGQADDRLGEVQGLLASDDLGSAPQVPVTLDAFAQQATEGAELMMDSYRQSRDPAMIADLRSFTVSAVGMLEELAVVAPESTQSDLASAAMTLRDIDARATEMCGACAEGVPALEVPALFLASAEASRALYGLDLDALDNSHPVTLGAGMSSYAAGRRAGKGTGKDAGTGRGAGKGAGASGMANGDGSSGDAGSSSSDPGTGASAGANTPDPSGSGLGLPDVKKPATKGGPDLPENVKAPKPATDSLDKGLGDLTETLLPELP